MCLRLKGEDKSLPVMQRKGFNVSTGFGAAVHKSRKEEPSLGGGGAGRAALLGSCRGGAQAGRGLQPRQWSMV